MKILFFIAYLFALNNSFSKIKPARSAVLKENGKNFKSEQVGNTTNQLYGGFFNRRFQKRSASLPLNRMTQDDIYNCLNNMTQHVQYDCHHAATAKGLDLADRWVLANVTREECLVPSPNGAPGLVFSSDPFPTPLSTVVRVWRNRMWEKIKVVPAYICRKPDIQ